jgi:hypothetical protein
MPSSVNILWTHITSAVALAVDLYSASILDLEMMGYFRALHKIIFGTKNTAKPPVDRRSSTKPAQSASENALTNKDFIFLILIPRPSVPLRYQSIRFTTVKWALVGAWRNWHTLFTEKAISGRVSVTYYSAPTALRYLVASSELNGSSPLIESFSEVDSDVLDGLHFCMPSLWIISGVYFSCDNKIPSFNWDTSIPRKYLSAPRSLSANSLPRSCNRAVTACEDELATTMSST